MHDRQFKVFNHTYVMLRFMLIIKLSYESTDLIIIRIKYVSNLINISNTELITNERSE